MRSKFSLLSAVIVGIGALLPRIAFAHCPLCTVGAGLAVVFAAWIGVSVGTIGIFLGAFAVALGLWAARAIHAPWRHLAHWIFPVLSFVLTVLPILPLAREYTSFGVYITGSYGSLLNRTYLVNILLLGSIVGGIATLIAPFISQQVTRWCDRRFPYQGILILFLLLLFIAIATEFLR